MKRGLRVVCCCVATWILGGCGDTAVQLVLTADPELNSAGDVVDRVDRVMVVVDSAEGLSGVAEAGETPGGGTAKDWDKDGQLEVSFVTELRSATLPVLEVGTAGNAGKQLDFRVFGLPKGSGEDPQQAIALGASSARTDPNELRRIGTPFNLVAAARPPRVVLVLPHNGASDVPKNLLAVTLVFSTTIDATTLEDRVKLTLNGIEDVAAVVSSEQALFDSAGGQETRTLVSIAPEAELSPGSYEVMVLSGIRSESQVAFDQNPGTEEPDVFRSGFTSGTGSFGPCPNGYFEQGDSCVPLMSCDNGCAQDYLCDGSLCVEDCRVLSACAAVAASCNQQTGLCR